MRQATQTNPVEQVHATLYSMREPLVGKVTDAESKLDKVKAETAKTVDKAKSDYEKALAAAKQVYEGKLTEVQTAIAVAETTKTEAQAALEVFDRMVSLDGKTSNSASKTNGASKHPAAKKAAKTAAKKTAGAKKTPASEAKQVKTQAHTPKTDGAKRALHGRDEVRNGVRPSIKDAIRLILGKKTMRSRDITAELIRLRWAPKSEKLSSYVPFVLSSGSKEKDKDGKDLHPVFESVDTGQGRGYYRVRHGAPPMDSEVRAKWGHVVAQGGTAVPTAAPVKASSKTTAAKSATPAKAAASKGAAAPKGGKSGQRACSVEGCGVLGHNKRGHDAWVAKQGGNAPEAKAAAPKTAAAKAAPKAKAAPAAPKQRAGKGQQKCGTCAKEGKEVFGHNAHGHNAWAAKQSAANAASTAPPAPKAAPTKTEPKKAAESKRTEGVNPPIRVQTAEEIIAEQGAQDDLMDEANDAFGNLTV
jgi:hypothetical protein